MNNDDQEYLLTLDCQCQLISHSLTSPLLVLVLFALAPAGAHKNSIARADHRPKKR